MKWVLGIIRLFMYEKKKQYPLLFVFSLYLVLQQVAMVVAAAFRIWGKNFGAICFAFEM